MDFCCSPSLITYTSASYLGSLETGSVITRSAESGDIKRVADVLTHSFYPPQGVLYWLHPVLQLGLYEDLRNRLRSSSHHYKCIVAAEGKEIVGTVEIALRNNSPKAASSPYLSNLAVHHVYRRQGIARQLLRKCEQIAIEWGCDTLSLHVLENNHSAKQLYITSGYQLQRIEWGWSSWLFQTPRRLFLQKKSLANNSNERS